MDTGPLPDLTNPSSLPPSSWVWVSVQSLAGLAELLAGRRHPERVLDAAVRVGVRRRGLAAGEREPVRARPAEHAEVIVVGVVLHHQDHDVLDLRDRVRARGQAGIGPRTGLPQRRGGTAGAAGRAAAR